MNVLILSIDTSGRNGSIGLFDHTAGSLAGHIEPLSGAAYSEQLIPKLTALLEREHRAASDIDAFVIASGPGSFTGLRVGIATVKALADVLQKPIAAVSVLDAVACVAMTGAKERIFVALDAGRKQVYVGEFQLDGRTRSPISERLLDISAFAAELVHDSTRVVTPD